MWIVSPRFDLPFIVAPGLLSALVVILFPAWFTVHDGLNPLLWLLLVMCVDVAHVYSTLFRTYFDKEEFEKRRSLYILAPLVAWLAGVLLYAQGALVFWRVAAYLAVYHFVRQQYGFMMIYSAKEGVREGKLLDRIVIYLATIYPLIYWHTHSREFSWFVDHDFVFLPFPWLSTVTAGFYLLTLTLYAIKEARQAALGRSVSIGKNLFLLSTALSWYIGIVVFNGDLAFTLTNVLAHGIPYIAFVWIYQKRKGLRDFSTVLERLIQPKSLWVYGTILLLLAFLEEGLWDALVWRERPEIFGMFQSFIPAAEGPLLTLLVPLLAMPQLTHYILDGFIWRVRKPDPEFKEFVQAEAH